MDVTEAQEALDKAVQQYVGSLGSEGVVTAYVMVAHTLSFDSDGDQMQEYPITGTAGSQPIYTTLGLLDIAKLRMAEFAVERVEED